MIAFSNVDWIGLLEGSGVTCSDFFDLGNLGGAFEVGVHLEVSIMDGNRGCRIETDGGFCLG